MKNGIGPSSAADEQRAAILKGASRHHALAAIAEALKRLSGSPLPPQRRADEFPPLPIGPWDKPPSSERGR
jgi:hypothetical protein